MENSDAYHNWLGIPPDEQPPNHYRLLGLTLFESNPNVIDNAADRQMAHLRAYEAGPQAESAERLLNELSAARLCLLNPGKKRAYDKQLKIQKQSAKSKQPARESTIPTPKPPPKQTAKLLPEPSAKQVAAPVRHSRPTTRPRRPPKSASQRVVMVVVAALGIVAGLLILRMSQEKPLVEKSADKTDSSDASTKKSARAERLEDDSRINPGVTASQHSSKPIPPRRTLNGREAIVQAEAKRKEEEIERKEEEAKAAIPASVEEILNADVVYDSVSLKQRVLELEKEYRLKVSASATTVQRETAKAEIRPVFDGKLFIGTFVVDDVELRQKLTEKDHYAAVMRIDPSPDLSRYTPKRFYLKLDDDDAHNFMKGDYVQLIGRLASEDVAEITDWISLGYYVAGWIRLEKIRLTTEEERNAFQYRRKTALDAKAKEIEDKRRAERTRTFKNTTGKFSVKAEFIKFENGKAHLKRDDGVVIQVSPSKLSEADQAWIREYVKSSNEGFR